MQTTWHPFTARTLIGNISLFLSLSLSLSLSLPLSLFPPVSVFVYVARTAWKTELLESDGLFDQY